MGGIVSEFFLPFALTVTFALLASLVCALTIIPILAYLFIDRVKLAVDETGEPKSSLWVRAYTPTIRFVLRSRRTKLGVLGLATILFLASVSIVGRLPTQFISTGSEKVLQVSVVPPAGVNGTAVLAIATQAETILRADPKVQLVETTVPGEGDTGASTLSSAFSGRPANSASMVVRLASDVDLDAYTTKVGAELAPLKTNGWDINVGQAFGFSSNASRGYASRPSIRRMRAASGRR